MKHNKRGFFSILLFSTIALCAYSQSVMTLDEAIRLASSEISSRLNTGTRIAVLSFNSASRIMSNHVLEELTNALVNEGKLTVVAQQNLALLQQEMNFQLSGDVSDETAQAIGRMLGAEMVVTGTQGIAGSNYRFRFQVLEVETAAIRYSGAHDVRNNSLVRNLMTDVISQNFSPVERAGAAALNLALGMGSFAIQKDTVGLVVTLAEGIGISLLVLSLTDLGTDVNFDGSASAISKDEQTRQFRFYTGIGIYGVGAIYGVYRALTYQKPLTNFSQANQNPWNIALVPDQRGSAAVQFSYTHRF